MVMSDFLEEKGSQKRKFMMKTVPEKSKPLHNFSLPTSLRWGNQRFLRCMKVDSNGEIVSFDHRSSGSEGDSAGKDSKFVKQRSLKSLPSPSKNIASSSGVKSKIRKEGDDGIEEFRAKLMVHLQTAAEKMQYSIPEEKEVDESVVASAVRPWNLRTRRAACKAPNQTGGGSSKLDENPSQQQQQQNVSPPRNENPSPKSLRLRGLAATVANEGSEEKERRKFSKTLTRGEIKEDFLRITGNNPSRRPKKRSKIIQKQLDNFYPGFWLTEVTTDSYRLPDELVETKKR